MKKYKQLLLAGALAFTLAAQPFCLSLPVQAAQQQNETEDDNTTNSNDSNKSEATIVPTQGGEPQAPGSDVDSSVNITLLDNWGTPTATHGQTVNIVLPLVNLGTDNLTNIIVSPELSTSADEFPFEIQKTSYNTYINDLPGSNSGLSPMDRRREVTYTLKTRDDISTGYQKLTFMITYTMSTGETATTTVDSFVQTVGKTGASSSDSDKVSTPRLIVSGFTTTPETVKAGDTFTLTLHITNTSKATSVNNLTFDLQAPVTGKDETSEGAAFLPVSGSSIIFVDSIAAGATKDISIDLESRADLSQKPYVLTVNMDYEDAACNPYTADASVSIPIKQEAKFDIGTMDVMPTSISVGSESNVMFSINNTGKTTLYNVNVTFEGASISGGDTFLGNIEIGATGNVDAMITGAAVTEDDGKVKAIISYEDESGNVNTKEKEFELFVTEESMGDFSMDDEMMMDDEFTAGQTSRSPIVYVAAIIIVVILIAVVVVVIILRNKKKKADNDLFDFDEGADNDELS